MVVDSLFLIAPYVCGFLCLVPVFVMQYLMSFLSFFLFILPYALTDILGRLLTDILGRFFLVFFHCGRESWLLYFNCVLTVL